MSEQISGDYGYAGFWWRFLAFIIDELLLSAVGWAMGMMVGVAVYGAHGDPGSAQGLAYLIGLLLNWLYYTMLESSSRRATFGKRACGLIVTDLNGAQISFGRANGRYFGKIISTLIFLIGFFMIGWTERKQGLHDKMAGTLVLRRRVKSVPVTIVPSAAG